MRDCPPAPGRRAFVGMPPTFSCIPQPCSNLVGQRRVSWVLVQIRIPANIAARASFGYVFPDRRAVDAYHFMRASSTASFASRGNLGYPSAGFLKSNRSGISNDVSALSFSSARVEATAPIAHQIRFFWFSGIGFQGVKAITTAVVRSPYFPVFFSVFPPVGELRARGVEGFWRKHWHFLLCRLSFRGFFAFGEGGGRVPGQIVCFGKFFFTTERIPLFGASQ